MKVCDSCGQPIGSRRDGDSEVSDGDGFEHETMLRPPGSPGIPMQRVVIHLRTCEGNLHDKCMLTLIQRL